MFRRAIAGGLLVLLCAVFLALGTWQVERMGWKLDLIARVDARVHAEPVPAPRQATTDDEYRRVIVTGTFLNDQQALVQAVTALGAGYWVMTPLQQADGTLIMINRGFLPADRRDRSKHSQPGDPVSITGLLRMTEPGGGFLRANDPDTDRWYSRDVAAIAASRKLPDMASYFIDADSTPNPGGYPVGGLTVIQFKNNHLVYAVTWYGLALMTIMAGVMLFRRRVG